MGHIRLGRLPATKEWQQVVALLQGGADVTALAAAIASAAEDELISARGDPVLARTVWLLTQLPVAARSDRFAAELTALGFEPGSDQSLVSIIAGFSSAVDSQIAGSAGRSDFGELARQAATESLSVLVGTQLPSLFGQGPDDLRREVGKLGTKDRFGALARDFFARLTLKTLDYYIGRALPDYIGPGRSLGSLQEGDRFRIALERHCREASEIVEAFAGGWYSKANYQGRLTRAAAESFTDYALKKIRDELRARRAGDA
jgi:hypothetical protein